MMVSVTSMRQWKYQESSHSLKKLNRRLTQLKSKTIEKRPVVLVAMHSAPLSKVNKTELEGKKTATHFVKRFPMHFRSKMRCKLKNER